MTTSLATTDRPPEPAFTVYTKPACVQCKATKNQLDRLHVPYKMIDITADDSAREHCLSLGYLQAPVVETAAGTHWGGFRSDRLKSEAAAWKAANGPGPPDVLAATTSPVPHPVSAAPDRLDRPVTHSVDAPSRSSGVER